MEMKDLGLLFILSKNSNRNMASDDSNIQTQLVRNRDMIIVIVVFYLEKSKKFIEKPKKFFAMKKLKAKTNRISSQEENYKNTH